MADFESRDFHATVLIPPGGRRVQICLAGDVDVSAHRELATVIADLADIPATVVYVDVAEITFADAMLPNFLAVLRAFLPPVTVLAVCRPAPMTRFILDRAGISTIVTMRDDLPLLDVSIPGPVHKGVA